MSSTSAVKVMSVLTITAWIVGCAAPKDHNYTLAAPGAVLAPAPATPLFIEVAPIALPERLARHQMLVRPGSLGPEVHVLEQHRWASSFENELRDALAAGVVARTGAIDVTKGGSHADQPA